MLYGIYPRLLRAAAPCVGVRSSFSVLTTSRGQASPAHSAASLHAGVPPLSSRCRRPAPAPCLPSFRAWRAVSSGSHQPAAGSGGAGEEDDRSVTFVQLRELLRAGAAYVVDVREAWEVTEYGGIPGAVNIPLLQLSECLSLSPAEFERRFSRAPPSRCGDSLVFSCLAGVRSLHALRTATKLGYARAMHFPGGWEEWSKQEKK